MGTAVVCDGCGVDLAGADWRMAVSSQSIEGGSVLVDLCFECSGPVRELPGYVAEAERVAELVRASYEASPATVYEEPPAVTEPAAN